MNKRFKNRAYIHYSNCFEDAETLLALTGDAKSALSIASAGDNSLALLTTGIQKLTVFDKDPVQLCLAKLKFSAFKHLQYEQVLILLGITEGDSLEVFQNLREHLDEDTTTYFDKNIDFIEKIKLMHSGRFEYYFQKLRKLLPFLYSKRKISEFMSMNNTAKQVKFYYDKIDTFRWRFIKKRFFSAKTVAKLGRDADFFKYADGDLGDMIVNRFLLCIENVANVKNPFLQYAVCNRFDCLPFYLRKENFQKIKDNIDKANFVLGDIYQVEKLKDKYDFFNLSDIFEYMSKEETKTQEIIIANMSNEGATIVFWNMMIERVFCSEVFAEIPSYELFKRECAYFYQALRTYKFCSKDNGVL